MKSFKRYLTEVNKAYLYHFSDAGISILKQDTLNAPVHMTRVPRHVFENRSSIFVLDQNKLRTKYKIISAAGLGDPDRTHQDNYYIEKENEEIITKNITSLHKYLVAIVLDIIFKPMLDKSNIINNYRKFGVKIVYRKLNSNVWYKDI